MSLLQFNFATSRVWATVFYGMVSGVAAEPKADPAIDVGGVLFQTVCAACHGLQGEGKLEVKSPSIASLPAWYVSHQLANFREERRGIDPTDVPGITMAAIAKTLQPEQLKAVAKYVESLPRVIPAIEADPEADLAEGKWLFEMRCMECHRFNASGELAFGSPPLIGLQGWYLEAQLEKFRTGKRGSVPGDVNGAKMIFTSSFIENERRLKDLVAYILTLNPEPFAAESEREDADVFERRTESAP